MSDKEQDKEQQEQPVEETQSPGYETSDINVKKIVWLGVAIIAFLIVSFVVLNSVFIKSKEELVYERVLRPGNPKLQQLREQEHATLTSYGIIDSTKGIYRIPIGRAMKLEAEESFHQRIQQAQSK